MHDKAEQSRINGAKSQGPTTDEGKEKVSQNATKHGCYSYRVVIRGESEEIYKAIYLAYWAEYKPETPSEADAVEDIINTRWKIRRLETIETNYYSMATGLYQDNQEFQDSAPDTQHRACFNHLIETQPGFEACAKFLERYQRANARAIRNLDRIRKAAGKPKVQANATEVEKEHPTNTEPAPPPQEPQSKVDPIERKQPIPITPVAPKREQGKAILEILLFILLIIGTITHSCRPIRTEGSNLKPTTTKEVKLRIRPLTSAPQDVPAPPQPAVRSADLCS